MIHFLGRFNTIRGRLFLLLAIVLVPAILVQALIYKDRYDTSRSEEVRANLDIARGMCMAFEQFVENVFQQELVIGLAFASGRLSLEDIRTLLERSAQEHPSVMSFAWTDPRGRIAHSSFRQDEGLDLRAHPFFLEMHAGGLFHVSDLFLLQGSGIPAFTISRSFRHESGVLLGIVVAVVDPSLLHTALAFERAGGGAVGLLDRNGRLVYRFPALELTWEERSLSNRPYIQDALKGREYIVHRAVGAEGNERLYAFTPIDSIGWIVGASKPETEIVAVIQARLLRHVGMFLVVILLSIPLAIFVAHTISSPVRVLRGRVLQGKEDEKVLFEGIKGPYEVQDLALALQRMTDELTKALNGAEEKASKLDAALESLADGVIFYNTEYDLVRMNRAAQMILGFSDEEVRLPAQERIKLFKIMTRKKRPPKVEELVGFRALRGETVRNEEILVQPKGKEEYIHVLTNAAPIRTQDGRLLGAIQTMNDLTAMKRVEASLRESEEKFRAVFEGAVESIYLHDLDGRFLDVNRKGYERLGYTKAEMMNMSIMDIDANTDLVAQRIGILGREDAISFETDMLCKDGSRFPVEINSKFLNYGDRSSYLAVVRDITERKQTEETLRNLANELEDRVRERTLELEKANRAKNDFLANMSHEIRTPLSGILGMAELSLDQGMPDELHDNIEMIRFSALSLNTIINDLLDFSAIEAGRLSIRPVEFSLHEELAKLTGGFKEQAKIHGLSFAFHIDDEVPERVVTDSVRLRQILINFLNNAIKFTPEGGVELGVRRPDCDHFAFSVSDTGIGIPENRINDIFQSFTQLDATVTKRFGGTGLGLAISKNLAELMGGTIEVESKEGTGSVFTLIIPVDIPEQEKRNGPEAKPVPSSSPRPLRILLAEDNPVNRVVIQRHLSKQGHSVSAVVDGRKALEALEKTVFDLVLMDVQMPEMNGMEATRAIREGASGMNPVTLPIIALTAYAMKDDRERFLSAGMDGYVTKPVDFDDLTREIAKVSGVAQSSLGRDTHP
jgi:PAS domain S-box-containing protein